MGVVWVWMANIIRRPYSLSALSLRRYRDFSHSLLRRLIPTAGDLVFFIHSKCVTDYRAVVVLWGGAPDSVIERSSAPLGGATPGGAPY